MTVISLKESEIDSQSELVREEDFSLFHQTIIAMFIEVGFKDIKLTTCTHFKLFINFKQIT